MADRSIHYEAAFEQYLRERGIPYVAVDEAKKALFASAKLKSFDFVVYCRTGPNLLVDVKGRQHRGRGGQTLQNWTTQRDIDDLTQWQQVFGDGFRAAMVFVYWVDAPLVPEPGMFAHKERWYRALAVDLDEYRNHMRRRSARWDTVCLPAADFRSLARPIEGWL